MIFMDLFLGSILILCAAILFIIAKSGLEEMHPKLAKRIFGKYCEV